MRVAGSRTHWIGSPEGFSGLVFAAGAVWLALMPATELLARLLRHGEPVSARALKHGTLALVLGLIAVFLIRLKNWARILAASAAVVVGLIGIGIVAVNFRWKDWHDAAVANTGAGIVFVALLGFLFLTQRETAATFRGGPFPVPAPRIETANRDGTRLRVLGFLVLFGSAGFLSLSVKFLDDLLALAIVFLGALMLLVGVVGIGLVLLRPWAIRLGVVTGWCLLAFALSGSNDFLFKVLEADQPPGVVSFLEWAGFALFPTAGVVLIGLLGRAEARRRAGRRTPAGDGTPIPNVVLALFSFFLAVLWLAWAVLGDASLRFGMSIQAARIFDVAMAGVFVATGIGFLRRKSASWIFLALVVALLSSLFVWGLYAELGDSGVRQTFWIGLVGFQCVLVLLAATFRRTRDLRDPGNAGEGA
jgi:hypothetical protein